MGDYCEDCQNLIDVIGMLEDAFDDGAGPPDELADAWYTHAVVSLGYPKVKRGDVPMKGQMTLVRPHSWMGPKGVAEPDEIRCRDCGIVTDPAFKSRYDDAGCEFDVSHVVIEPWGPGTASSLRSWAGEHGVHVHDVIEGCWCGESHE